MKKENLNISYYIPYYAVPRKQYGKLELYSIVGTPKEAGCIFIKNPTDNKPQRGE